MYEIKNILFLVIIGVVTVFDCMAEDKVKPIIYVVGEEVLSTSDINGTEQQFAVVRAIFEPLGYQVTTRVFPYKRAIKMIENGDADMMVGMLKDNLLKVHYSFQPHVVDKLVAVFIHEQVGDWQSIISLENKNIITLAGLSNPLKEYFHQFKLRITEVSTREQAFKKLKYAHSDYLIDSESSYFFTQKENRITENFIAKQIGYLEVYAAFSTHEYGSKIKKQWDKNFPNFINSPQAKEIFDKWNFAKEYKVLQSYLKAQKLGDGG